MHIQLARINNEVVTRALRLKYRILVCFIWLINFYFLETILYKTAYEFVHSNYFCRAIYIVNMFSEFVFIMLFLYANDIFSLSYLICAALFSELATGHLSLPFRLKDLGLIREETKETAQ